MAAVAAAGHADSAGVQGALSADPVEKRVDVLIAVLALCRVVEKRERFSVTGRAANVWIDQRNAQFVQIIVSAAQEDRLRLPLRPAVYHHQHRPLAGKLPGRGQVQEARDLPAVK